MPKIINYSNRKYSHLTMIRNLGTGRAGVGAIWLALCDCGRECEVQARQVAYGRVRSCGKCQLGRDLARIGRMRSDRYRKAELGAYKRYFDVAARRRKLFKLEGAQFIDLVRRNCSACAKPASQSETGLNALTLIVDSGDYTLGNCVPVCTRCRKMKQNSNLLDFLESCREIAATYEKALSDIKST